MRFVRRMERLDDHFGGRTYRIPEAIMREYFKNADNLKSLRGLFDDGYFMATFPEANMGILRPLAEYSNGELAGMILMNNGYKPELLKS